VVNRVLSVWRGLRLGVSRKLILLSMLVGCLSAAGAIALFVGLEVASHYCQGVLMGLSVPAPTTP